jgi:GTP-binding protein HflX
MAPGALAVLVGIQTPDIGDVAHQASLEELGRLVKTLGYEVVGTLSQKREGAGAAALLGSGKLVELAALTGGTGVVGSMAPAPKSKARQRFERGGRRCRVGRARTWLRVPVDFEHRFRLIVNTRSS